MDSIFLDSLEVDLERLKRINKPSIWCQRSASAYEFAPYNVLLISPSQSIEKIAGRYARQLPWAIRLLLKVVGAMRRNASNLVSYLLFEKEYCRALIDLGYQDAMNRKEELIEFIELLLSQSLTSFHNGETGVMIDQATSTSVPKPLTFALLRLLADGEFHSGEVLAQRLGCIPGQRQQCVAHIEQYGLTCTACADAAIA